MKSLYVGKIQNSIHRHTTLFITVILLIFIKIIWVV